MPTHRASTQTTPRLDAGSTMSVVGLCTPFQRNLRNPEAHDKCSERRRRRRAEHGAQSNRVRCAGRILLRRSCGQLPNQPCRMPHPRNELSRARPANACGQLPIQDTLEGSRSDRDAITCPEALHVSYTAGGRRRRDSSRT